MAGAEQIQMQQFEVAALAAPPALLCHQLQHSSSTSGLANLSSPRQQVVSLVLQNPALLLRVLDAQFKARAGKPPKTLSGRLATLDLQWLHSLLFDSALQQVLHHTRISYHFLQLYWQQARHTALLARELARMLDYPDPVAAETCGLLLNAGMLVLEQQHREAWVGLFQETMSQSRLLDAEQQTLGYDHIEAGVKLLQNWELEQECVDALRYQMMPLSAVLDATPLVRICWLANRMGGQAVDQETLRAAEQLFQQGAGNLERLVRDQETFQAAEQLFQLGAGDLEKLLRNTDEHYRRELNEWRDSQQSTLQLPLDDQQLQVFNQEVKDGLQKLQLQMLSESALAALESLEVNDSEDLRAVLTRALQQAEVDPLFIVMACRDSDQLSVLASNRVASLPEALGLRVQAQRSRIADLVLAGDLGSLAATSLGLTVIDRQFLGLLGGNGLLCEPVAMEDGYAVLLLANSGNYPQRPLLRSFIKRKLQNFMQDNSGRESPAEDESQLPLMLYKQRVREAVHEAKNPLAIIKNYLQILNMKQGEAGAGKEIKLISAEIDRVGAILTNLRQAEAEAGKPAETDINALLRGMHKVFAQAFTADKRISIELRLAEDPLLLLARADALKQILTNLVKNSAEAIVDSGNIVFATKRNIAADGKIYLQLSVTDDGPGIAADFMPRLFVAGNTTKGGDHNGSGLAIVKRLVDEMGGRVSCHSDKKGTEISILLPQINR